MAKWIGFRNGWDASFSGQTNAHCKDCGESLKGKDAYRYSGNKGSEFEFYCGKHARAKGCRREKIGKVKKDG